MTTWNHTRYLLAVLAVFALTLLAAPALAGDGIKVALQSADSGNYLGRCNGCVPGGAYPDSAFVHVKPAELQKAHWAHWKIESIGNGLYTLQAADSGNYLARCNSCVPNGAYPDSAFVHVKPSEIKTARYAHWRITHLADGTYALQASDSGNYLGRCNNCIPKGAYSDSAFVHVKPSELQGAHWAHWKIQFLP